jgi:hypothetical protein
MPKQESDEHVTLGVPADPDMLVSIRSDDMVPIERDQVGRVGRYVACEYEHRAHERNRHDDTKRIEMD